MRNIEIKYKKIDELIPYVNNTRTHSDEQVTQICSSIKEFGFTNPVLIIAQRWCDYKNIDIIKINGEEVSWEEYKLKNKA